jgi:DNA polymerase (family 10)
MTKRATPGTMTKQEVAELLDDIGTLLELRGENKFKCIAFHNASRIIGALSGDLPSLIESKGLYDIKGIGKGIAAEIIQAVQTGRNATREDLLKTTPPGLLQMMRLQGLGPKRIRILHDKLGIKSIEELKKAAERHALADLDGFGAKTEANILQSIDRLSRHADKHLYSAARAAADRILAEVAGFPGVIACEAAGSLRRRKETIGDIDILASAKPADAPKIMKRFTAMEDVESVTAHGATKSSVVLASGIPCDLRIVAPKEYPFALAYFTGSKEHNVEMRARARRLGWSLNEYAFTSIGDAPAKKKPAPPPRCESEEEIYAALKLAFVPPELREDMGEFDAAAKSALPKLLEPGDLRGTFHCHTTYSDGTNTLEEMAAAARALGWEYLGIADHSKVAAYARGLTPERVRAQQKEIDALNAKFPKFRLFKGTEVDILADGTLDWTDAVLATFDYVVASVHSKFNMTEAEATKRIIRAVKHKHVTMLGHPTGRLLLERDGYPVNMAEVIQAAADYGTIIEINAHPMRLDLDWRLVRQARDKGVKIAINPDAHATKGLLDVAYGVGIARKGWLEKKDVVNACTLKQVVAYMNR